MTTRRDETLATLIEIRRSAAADLACMPSIKEGSEWARDRERDLAWASRKLANLGRFGIGPGAAPAK
jgi:hypothetical protein